MKGQLPSSLSLKLQIRLLGHTSRLKDDINHKTDFSRPHLRNVLYVQSPRSSKTAWPRRRASQQKAGRPVHPIQHEASCDSFLSAARRCTQAMAEHQAAFAIKLSYVYYKTSNQRVGPDLGGKRVEEEEEG